MVDLLRFVGKRRFQISTQKEKKAKRRRVRAKKIAVLAVAVHNKTACVMKQVFVYVAIRYT